MNDELGRENAAKERYAQLPLSEVNRLASNIILTTSFFVSGSEIESEIEIITAECVYGMNVFKDIFAGLRDFFGGRSQSMQEALRDARKTSLAELRREALMVGADAVIGIDLDYSEISGGKKAMLMLVASGTAVKLKNKRTP